MASLIVMIMAVMVVHKKVLVDDGESDDEKFE